MRQAFLLATTAVALSPVAGVAQGIAPGLKERVEAKADSLRSELECPAEVDWPELPSSNLTTFRSDAPVRTDITIPQYAYYYHDDLRGPAACLPVIIVQAQGSSLGWIAVLEPPPAAGAAFEQLFDLLGTEKPVEDAET